MDQYPPGSLLKRNKGGSQLAGLGFSCLAGNSLFFSVQNSLGDDQRGASWLFCISFRTERRAQMSVSTGNEMFVISLDIDPMGKATERIPDLEKSAQLHNTLL